jgi:hypothetical protein
MSSISSTTPYVMSSISQHYSVCSVLNILHYSICNVLHIPHYSFRLPTSIKFLSSLLGHELDKSFFTGPVDVTSCGSWRLCRQWDEAQSRCCVTWPEMTERLLCSICSHLRPITSGNFEIWTCLLGWLLSFTSRAWPETGILEFTLMLRSNMEIRQRLTITIPPCIVMTGVGLHY